MMTPAQAGFTANGGDPALRDAGGHVMMIEAVKMPQPGHAKTLPQPQAAHQHVADITNRRLRHPRAGSQGWAQNVASSSFSLRLVDCSFQGGKPCHDLVETRYGPKKYSPHVPVIPLQFVKMMFRRE